jgi:hypothetical protein
MNEAHMLHVLRVANEIRTQKKRFNQETWFLMPSHTTDVAPCDLGGHMCFDAEFKRLGLRIKRGFWPIPLFGPKGDEWMAEDALANLLGLNEVETNFIFGEVDQITYIDDRLMPEVVRVSIDNCIWRVERVIAGEFAGCTTWVEYRFG